MSEWNRKQKKGFAIVALLHLELGLLLGTDIFFGSFMGLLIQFSLGWLPVIVIVYGVSGILFIMGFILDYQIWHKGLETIFRKKEAKQ